MTSPRSPNKLHDEIKFLVKNFSGQAWNTQTQKDFYIGLSKQDFFKGSITGNITFKARDRINRAPKSLGLIDLKPTIEITEAGKQFLFGKRPEEIFLRQLLKFQLPSPYHKDSNLYFRVKPYLELMRLIKDFKGLTKNEIAIYVMQLTDLKKYLVVEQKIEAFRKDVKLLRSKKLNYRKFLSETFSKEISVLFNREISNNEVSTRETKNSSLEKFITTKQRNFLDYADAAIRYLRATGLFTISARSFKITIIPEKFADVEFILNNMDREPAVFNNEKDFKNYLFNPEIPKLLVDNNVNLINKIVTKNPLISAKELAKKDIDSLKDIYYEIITNNRIQIIDLQKKCLKEYKEYDDIIKIFSEIENKSIIDPSLFFEWNVWRSFVMLNDGDIDGNFKTDDDGAPLYTAPGNTPDITCKYNDFSTIVEVTLSSGHKQYEMEGEPVARHYGNYKRESADDVYCIFIAPKVSQATIAHYYALYRINIGYYGGNAKIIPIDLTDFKELLKNAYSSKEKPNSKDIKKLWAELSKTAIMVGNENEWAQIISSKVRAAFK